MRQMTFPGLGAAPARESHNLFFALWPGDAVRAAIEAAAERLRYERNPAGRWIKRHRYHMTLRFLGTFDASPEPLVEIAMAAGDAVRVAAFDLVLDTAGSFSNRQIPWWIGCETAPEPLADVAAAIDGGLRASGLRAPRTPLAPHVTILRDAVEALAPTRIAPIRWPVGEIVLIDSTLGATSSYRVLKRWPLRA